MHNIMMSTMLSEQQLIVDFPTHRNRSVHFSETSKLYIVPRHDDIDGVHPHDLWYNKSDYSRMRLVMKKSVLRVLALASAGMFSYSGDEGSSDDCLVGIEHLLTPATVQEVVACRRRCVQAVLQEQARQMMNPFNTSGWRYIAIASLDETRRATVRARKLGKLHHDAAKGGA